MAGNYPDAPSWRMAHDRDGTQWFTVGSTGIVTDMTHETVVKINDEDPSTGETVGYRNNEVMGCIFPELRDLDAYFINSKSAGVTDVQVSTDTTNLIDGTWTAIPVSYYTGASKEGYRTQITSSTALAIRGIKFWLSGDIGDAFSVHLYGEIAPGQNPHRLDLWDPLENNRCGPAHFDWGNVPRSSSDDVQFRVKNLSGEMSAADIRVAFDALTGTTPSVPGQHTLSIDGGPFLPQINIGSLGPGAISPVITLRRITPDNASLSLWTFRVFAESTSWS